MIKNGIEIKSYVREKKGHFYVVLVYTNAAGKRRDKSFATKLPVKGNKKKAEAMAREFLEKFEIPPEDLSPYDVIEKKRGKSSKKSETVNEAIENLSLSDVSNEQVSNMLFADYLVLYLPIARKRGIEEITYAGYVGNVKSPIGPYFRGKKITLDELTAKDIQEEFL